MKKILIKMLNTLSIIINIIFLLTLITKSKLLNLKPEIISMKDQYVMGI